MYFKFESGEGFAFSKAMFSSAHWSKFGDIEIALDGIVLSVKPVAD